MMLKQAGFQSFVKTVKIFANAIIKSLLLSLRFSPLKQFKVKLFRIFPHSWPVKYRRNFSYFGRFISRARFLCVTRKKISSLRNGMSSFVAARAWLPVRLVVHFCLTASILTPPPLPICHQTNHKLNAHCRNE